MSSLAVARSSASGEERSFDQRVVDLVNQIRSRYGLQTLRFNSALNDAAEAHNLTMINQRRMAHDGIGDGTPGDRIRRVGFAGGWGENVAVGQRSPEQVVDEWMASPGHRANILKPQFAQLGVAFGLTADGLPFWSQEFGT